MKQLKITFWTGLLIISGLWLLADDLIPEPFNYFSFRSVFMQYSGILAMSVMSVAMILALRTQWIEKKLGGLDKTYRLHKWLGITALVVAVIHWWWAQGTKWMVGWGWLAKPERKSHGAQVLSSVEQWFRNQRGLAESMGEWAFYAVVILIALALIKRFPYRLFRKTHQLIAVAYLVLVYHTIILVQTDYWLQPIGWVMAVLLLSGTVSAVLVLTARVGKNRQTKGVIEAITYYPGLKVVETIIKMNHGWTGHKPGQFAFVTSNKKEGPHPYTIASAWDADDRKLMFVTKGLGDWTSQLPGRLKQGMSVLVEGPYGCFDFNDNNSGQIWVGAGIGITPFIARMKYLSKNKGKQCIDLFHATTDYEQAAIDKLMADAKAAGVKLHLIVTPKDGRLTPKQIREAVPDWNTASIWYCGPNTLGKVIKDDFISNGLSSKDFHQELFEMR